MKNIIICSDGTGNSDIKGRGTNVFKTFEAVDLNGHRTNAELVTQVALYDDGVGTESFRPLRIFAGVTGYGLSRNVRQLYKELVRIYDPGDRIFLFGFSRGAFTVRTLASLITKCGILDFKSLNTPDKLKHAVREAYRAYRSCYRTALAELFLGKPQESAIDKFRERHSLNYDVSIAFLGVWDTVDAVGTPFHISDAINLTFYRFKFPNYRLNDRVEKACHALSIDDERQSFHPLLWQEAPKDKDRIEQVWFAGAHSNVGGGYPKQGMSLVAFDWMMRKAQAVGLRLLASVRDFGVEHANIDDRLYNPRAGLGNFYRWKPRDVSKICRVNDVEPKIHLSVFERIAHGTDDYAPGNLPFNAKVVVSGQDKAAIARARGIENAVKTAAPPDTSLLARTGIAIRARRAAYWLMVAFVLATLIAASAPEGVHALYQPWPLLKNAAALVMNVATLQYGAIVAALKMLAMSRALLMFLVGGFALALLLSFVSITRMRAHYSKFWHRVQPTLRAALKQAQERTRENAGPASSVVDVGLAKP